jgi:hypothetical protein
MTGLTWKSSRHLPIDTGPDGHAHGHAHGESWHIHPHVHQLDGEHIAADPAHGHIEEDLRTLRPVRHKGKRQRQRQRQPGPETTLAATGGQPMTRRTAWNPSALARGHAGQLLDELPLDAQEVLRAAGLVQVTADGFEVVALTTEADDELLIALSETGEDWEPAPEYDSEDLLLTVGQAEAELAGRTGAFDTLPVQDDIAGEVFRLGKIHEIDQLRSMGYVVPRPIWEARTSTPSVNVVGMTAEDVPNAVYELGEYGGGVIPTQATTWYDPHRDGEGKGAIAGDKAVALARVAQAVYDPGQRAACETEAADVAAVYSEEFGLSAHAFADEFGLAAEPPHSHSHYHVGSLQPHRHEHDHDDGGVHDHPHSDGDLREAAGLAEPGSIADTEAERLLDVADAMGLDVRGRQRFHGRPNGSGRPVTSRTRAHHSDLEHEPGDISYGSPPEVDESGSYGGSEYEITKRYPDLFTRPAPIGKASGRPR